MKDSPPNAVSLQLTVGIRQWDHAGMPTATPTYAEFLITADSLVASLVSLHQWNRRDVLAKSTLFGFCSRAIIFDPKIAFLAPRRRFSPPGSLLRHGTSGFDLRIPTVNSHETAFWGLSFMYQPAQKFSGASYRVTFR